MLFGVCFKDFIQALRAKYPLHQSSHHHTDGTLLDKGIERLRYTGKPHRMINHWRATSKGIELGFNFELDPDTAGKASAYEVARWDYKWAHSYGSKQYLPGTDKPGVDKSNPIKQVTISKDGKRVFLSIPDLKPVHQMQIKISVKAADGSTFKETLLSTINALAD